MREKKGEERKYAIALYTIETNISCFSLVVSFEKFLFTTMETLSYKPEKKNQQHKYCINTFRYFFVATR